MKPAPRHLFFAFLISALAACAISYSGSALAVPPTPPTQVFANPTNNGVTVSWQPVTGATSYNLYRATVSGLTRSSTGLPGFTASTGIAAASFTANALANDTVYYFIVTAVNASGESTESPEVASQQVEVRERFLSTHMTPFFVPSQRTTPICKMRLSCRDIRHGDMATWRHGHMATWPVGNFTTWL